MDNKINGDNGIGKKYRLTEETKEVNGKKLYRIQAIKSFGDVKSGELGGWIESDDNLSHEGNCWVYDNAQVYENAMVYDNARVYGEAEVYENARVCRSSRVYGNARVYGNSQVFETSLVYDNAHVYGNARVYGKANVYNNAYVYGNAEVYGDSWVYGNANVFGNSEVYGNANVFGNAEVIGNAKVYENALIKQKKDFICILPIGRKEDSITFYKTKDGICVVYSYFNGSIDTFEQAVQETHGNNEYAEQFRAAIQLAKTSIR